VKSGGAVTLYSRNRKILNKRFPYIVESLADLPAGTVVDGELVGLDDKMPTSTSFWISCINGWNQS
jgi:ATP-dependent DNA ligase